MLHVVYRVCDSVEVSSARGRFCPLAKPDLIRGCLRSFMAPSADVLFHVLADGCSDRTVEFVRACAPSPRIERARLGNAASFCRCVEIAASLPKDDWVLMLEDDYFALRRDVLTTLPAALDALSAVNGRKCAIMPDDYLDRYRRGKRIGTDVCVTPQGNFMRIDKTTCTFAASAGDIAAHKDELLRFRCWPRVGENGSVNLMWRDVPLFCPLPAWTVHVQVASAVPPYVDPRSVSESVAELSAR